MAKYDICYFEALGAELEHLQEETDKAIEKGLLPKGWKSLITPDNLQQYMAKHPELELPDLRRPASRRASSPAARATTTLNIWRT